MHNWNEHGKACFSTSLMKAIHAALPQIAGSSTLHSNAALKNMFMFESLVAHGVIQTFTVNWLIGRITFNQILNYTQSHTACGKTN